MKHALVLMITGIGIFSASASAQLAGEPAPLSSNLAQRTLEQCKDVSPVSEMKSICFETGMAHLADATAVENFDRVLCRPILDQDSSAGLGCYANAMRGDPYLKEKWRDCVSGTVKRLVFENYRKKALCLDRVLAARTITKATPIDESLVAKTRDVFGACSILKRGDRVECESAIVQSLASGKSGLPSAQTVISTFGKSDISQSLQFLKELSKRLNHPGIASVAFRCSEVSGHEAQLRCLNQSLLALETARSAVTESSKSAASSSGR